MKRLVASIAIAGAGLASMSGARAGAPAPPTLVHGPVRVTPADQPFFMEPYLLATHDGLVVVAQAKPTPRRIGWTCRSGDGEAWDCQIVEQPDGITDWADGWLADSRGSACPAYDGITMIALQGAIGARRYLEPVAYASRDGGKTWTGPVLIPSPIAIADGSKTLATGGHVYAAWRDFAFAASAYVGELGTASDPCAWSQPMLMPDGHDHPRLAPGTAPGGFAFRGTVGVTALTMEQYDANLMPAQAPSVIAPTQPLYQLTQLCDTTGAHCFASYDIGQTLARTEGDTYATVWLDRPDDDRAGRTRTVARFATSPDGGRTWSPPVIIGGGRPGSAAWMSQLSYDASTKTLVFADIERDTPEQREARVRVRVLRDGAWSDPVDVGTTLTWSGNSDRHLGDYFGLHALNGEIHVAWQKITEETQGLAHIEYARLHENLL